MKKQTPRIVVPPHPGPMLINNSDPGVHGFLIAIAFAILGIVGLPLYRMFFVGTICVGAVVACLLHVMRKARKKPTGLFPLEQYTQEEPSESVDTGHRLPNNQRMDLVAAFVSLH